MNDNRLQDVSAYLNKVRDVFGICCAKGVLCTLVRMTASQLSLPKI